MKYHMYTDIFYPSIIIYIEKFIDDIGGFKYQGKVNKEFKIVSRNEALNDVINVCRIYECRCNGIEYYVKGTSYLTLCVICNCEETLECRYAFEVPYTIDNVIGGEIHGI